MSDQWDLTAAQRAAIDDSFQDGAFAWLFELPIPDEVTPRTLRIVNRKRAVEFGTTTSAAALTWDPFPFGVPRLREDNAGTQEVVQVALANVSREVAALMEAFDGLGSQRGTLRLVNLELLDEPRAFIEITGKVLGSTVSAAVVTLELGEPDITRTAFPLNRISSRSCRHTYKGARCGYTGALPSCDKSLDGPDGCEVHANEPRWGGFRGARSTT